MVVEERTTPPEEPIPSTREPELVPAFVIVWSEAEPWRVGEAALVCAHEELVIGRSDGFRRLPFVRQRPGSNDLRGGLAAPGISREHLLVRRLEDGSGVRTVRRGQAGLRVNGVPVEEAVVTPGQTVEIERQLLLYCTLRPTTMPPLRHAQIGMEFGEPDADGIIGESAPAWHLREELVRVARTVGHVLITGESGTGKELAARAIRARSDRARGPFVATNAATFSPGLIDAELFGHARDFPNAGMPERNGLVGEADGGVLFLDEIGEISQDLQAHFLRVFDRGGEYRRVGEAHFRRANLRVVGATNRDPTTLKHDFVERLRLRLDLPSLRNRREDIALLVRAHVLEIARLSPETVGPYVRTVNGRPEPRVSVALMDALVRWSYSTNVRELEMLLARAMSEARGDVLNPPAQVRALFDRPAPGTSVPPRSAEPVVPEKSVVPKKTVDDVRAALEAEGGNVSRAARALEMPRPTVHRIIKKHQLKDSKDE